MSRIKYIPALGLSFHINVHNGSYVTECEENHYFRNYPQSQ